MYLLRWWWIAYHVILCVEVVFQYCRKLCAKKGHPCDFLKGRAKRCESSKPNPRWRAAKLSVKTKASKIRQREKGKRFLAFETNSFWIVMLFCPSIWRASLCGMAARYNRENVGVESRLSCAGLCCEMILFSCDRRVRELNSCNTKKFLEERKRVISPWEACVCVWERFCVCVGGELVC